MKKIFLITASIIGLTLFGFSQTLYVANNNPGAATGTNVFTGSTALADAHTAAVNGDIIYVVPSQVSYGTFTITKELTIFGIGISPVKDLANKSLINEIFLNSSNVRLSGLIINSDVNVGVTLSSVTLVNITIENCRLGRVEMGSSNGVNVDQLLVRNNIIEGYGSVATSFLLYTTSNVTITNNVIYTSCCSANSMRVTGAIISYNTFVSDGNRGIDANLVANDFKHNIFYGSRVDLSSTSINNVWTDNLSFGATNMIFGAGATSNGTISGNIEDSDPLLTNTALSNTWIEGQDYALLSGSPALAVNNGTGEDIGISGGPTPFDAEGNLLPLIESVTIPAMIPVGSDLPVTIKAKGN